MNLLSDLVALVNKYAGPVVTYLATYGVAVGTGVAADSTSALVAVVPAVAHLVADVVKDAKAVKAAAVSVQDSAAAK
jgi:hypothetical protein